MSLLNNIQNYLNFSKQTNFDAGKQPMTSEEAARKAGYHGRIEKDTASVAKTEAPKAETKKIADVKAPELTPPEDTAKLAAFEAQRKAAMEKAGKEAVAQLSGNSGTANQETTKAKATGDQEIKLANVDIKADNDNDKYGKFVAEHGDLKAKKTPNPDDKYNKFVAERGSLKAKGTPKRTYTPWDKDDKATDYAWKNGAGQTVKLYRDKEGTYYIRGAEGKVKIFDNKGQVIAPKRYGKLTGEFQKMMGPATNDIREKAADGTTTTIAESRAASTRGNTPIPASTKLAGNDLGKNNPNRIRR